MTAMTDPWSHEIEPPHRPASIQFPSGVRLRVTSGATGHQEEHWDPNDTGNPLLDTGEASVRLSPHFTVGELRKSGKQTARTARIDPALIACLERIRANVGVPVRVTSGYRSWGYNKALYAARPKKVTLSRHCSGQAADIAVTGMTGLELAKAVVDACGTDIGVGIDSHMTHVDVRGVWALWTYFSGERDRAQKDALRAHVRATGGRLPGSPSRPSKAAAANGRYARRLGWHVHLPRIARLLGVRAKTPIDESIVGATRAWQRGEGLAPDGKIGPDTWTHMGPALGLPESPDTGATGARSAAKPAVPSSTTGAAVTLRKVVRKSGVTGWAGYAGGRLSDTVRDLQAGGHLKMSARDLDTLQRVADVESRGQTSGVNTWDTAVVSAGFKQWTLHVGTLQDLIRRAPGAFARHGIRLDENAPPYDFKVPQTPIAGVPSRSDLRERAWAERFLHATLEHEAVVAAVKKGLEDVAAAERHGRQIAAGAGVAWSPHLASPRGRALLVQLRNNRPAYAKRVLPRLLRRTEPGTSPAQFLRAFVDEIIDEYERSEAEGKSKAIRWTTKVMR